MRITAHQRYILLACIFLLLLSGCKSNELEVLESTTSMVRLQTGREVSRSTRDRGEALGQRTFAQTNLEYEPVDNHTKQEVFNEIIATLQRNNWKREDINAVPGFYQASFKQGNDRLKVSVIIVENQNLVSVRFENIE